MSAIASLLKALPTINQSRMIGSGYGLWMTWNGQLHNSIIVTLKDYGVIPMVQESNQALWFSPTNEIFRALARLQVYARLNPMPVFCQVLPVTFQVGYDLSTTMSVSADFGNQAIEPSEEFEVWLHPKLKEELKRIAGLDARDRSPITGMSNSGWMTLEADEGLNYETTLSWYCAIRPVGRMTEKEAVMGWRAYLEQIKEVLSRLSIKYLVGTRNELTLVQLSNLRDLRTFCMEVLRLGLTAKEDDGHGYWPSVIAAVPQKNLQFAEEVVGKFNVDWNKLSPDLPHLQYRDAFMISEWFNINEARYGGDESLNSWCNISLGSDGEVAIKAAADVDLPRTLMVANQERECFYCGLQSHTAGECPTKALGTLKPSVWTALSKADIKDMAKGLHAIDGLLDKDNLVESIRENLGQTKELSGQLFQAVFEINSSSQLRTLQQIWRARGKEMPDGLAQTVDDDGQFVSDGLAAIVDGDYELALEELKRSRVKYPRSYIPSSLHGFLVMETGDDNQAMFYWQEAERLSYTPLQQSYFLYLQARLLEVSGELKEAAGVYRRAATTSPKWLEPQYRGAVCMVKMGFTGQAVDGIVALIEESPHFFNRVLIDPELDRGRTHVMQVMWEEWGRLEETVIEFREDVEKLQSEIVHRFEEDHEFFDPAQEKLRKLKTLSERNNFVAFKHLIAGVNVFRDKLSKQVERDVKRMKVKTEYFIDRLKDIQKEASWFPFPKLLLEFNRDFNYCVEKMNWIMHQHIKAADNFRQARRFLIEIEERLSALQSRLVTLRIVRDSTLFALMLGRAFIWLEVIGLGLALVGIPAIIYFTRGVENIWILDIIRDKQWEFQKGLILILSISALVLAALKSAFAFERRKRELFERNDE